VTGADKALREREAGPVETARPCRGACNALTENEDGACDDCHAAAERAGDHSCECFCGECLTRMRLEGVTVSTAPTLAPAKPAGPLLPPPAPVLPATLPEVLKYLRAAPERALCAAALLERGEPEGLLVVEEEAAVKRHGVWPSILFYVGAWREHGAAVADAVWSTECHQCSRALALNGLTAVRCEMCREPDAPARALAPSTVLLPPSL
jgi:hypothetical protein